MLPNTNCTDSTEQRYERCVRWYNIAAGRFNSAIDAYEAADRELRDAERWFTEARDDLNRAAAVLSLDGAP
jgi:hypothetical protein